MTPQTEQKLIALNKTFYDEIGQYWNNSPDYFWEGWYKLVPYIQVLIHKNPTKNRFSVLDIGAGNGRWYHFLKSQFPGTKWDYTGVDISQFGKQTEVPHGDMNFVYFDILNEEWNFRKEFDLIVSMGLVHHIPGQRLLEKFMKNYTKSMKFDGLGIFTTWQYMRLARLQKRLLVGKSKEEILQTLKIEESEFREGDNLLSWVKHREGVRFSHYFPHQEVMKLLAKETEIQLLDSYLADDREQNRNEYFVVKKIS